MIVSGKLRTQHANFTNFEDNYMISSGQPVNVHIDSAARHVLKERSEKPGSLGKQGIRYVATNPKFS